MQYSNALSVCQLLSYTGTKMWFTVLVPGLLLCPAVAEISAGFQQVKIGERGGRRRDFHDADVHTRQMMEHVKDSKSGKSSTVMLNRDNIILQINSLYILLKLVHL